MKINFKARHERGFPEFDFDEAIKIFKNKDLYQIQHNKKFFSLMEYFYNIFHEPESSEQFQVCALSMYDLFPWIQEKQNEILNGILIAVNVSGVKVQVMKVDYSILKHWSDIESVIEAIELECQKAHDILTKHFGGNHD